MSGTFCQCDLCGTQPVCLCVNPYQLWIFTEVLFLCLGMASFLSGSQVPRLCLEPQIPRGILGKG